MNALKLRWVILRAGFALLAIGLAQQAQAVPSFARQTGLSCNVCHSTPPELTSFGRLFKLNGYTLTGIKQIQAGESGKNLSIDQLPPLSAMIQIADTQTSKAQPGTQNGNVQFPQQLSLFYAGAISQNMGAFAQLTYTQTDDHFTMDNADIRYADHTQLWGSDTIYGVTINNAPTVEDVWNTTSAWGFPWMSSGVAPTPAASTLLGGGLTGSGSVAGAGVYTFWDNRVVRLADHVPSLTHGGCPTYTQDWRSGRRDALLAPGLPVQQLEPAGSGALWNTCRYIPGFLRHRAGGVPRQLHRLRRGCAVRDIHGRQPAIALRDLYP